MRCIDADALIKDVLDLQNCYNGFSDAYDKACIIGLIDEMPTISPKTGRWIKKRGTVYCSECKGSRWSETFEQIVRRFNYCPNCGSKMDEVEE